MDSRGAAASPRSAASTGAGPPLTSASWAARDAAARRSVRFTYIKFVYGDAECLGNKDELRAFRITLARLKIMDRREGLIYLVRKLL